MKYLLQKHRIASLNVQGA